MDQDLVDAVVSVLAEADADPSLYPPTQQERLRHIARAVVAVVQTNEACAGCGCPLVPPAMCPECAAKSG